MEKKQSKRNQQQLFACAPTLAIICVPHCGYSQVCTRPLLLLLSRARNAIIRFTFLLPAWNFKLAPVPWLKRVLGRTLECSWEESRDVPWLPSLRSLWRNYDREKLVRLAVSLARSIKFKIRRLITICHLICSSNNDGEANSRVCTLSHSKGTYEGNDSEETSRRGEQQRREHSKRYLHVLKSSCS